MQNHHPTENENSLTHAASESAIAEIESDGLTYKQRRFVEAYLGEARGNGTRAAEIAGYAGNRDTLKAMASENLAKPYIRAHVRAAAIAVIGEPRVIEELAKIATTPATPIETNARVKALELLMRFHGMLVDKVEHSGTIEQQVRQIVVNVTAPQAQQTLEAHARAHEGQTTSTDNEE
jgi:phage terminase small subunit